MLVQGLKTVINTRLHIRCIVVLEKIALGCGCVPVYQCPACLAHLWCSVSLLNKKLSLSLSLSVLNTSPLSHHFHCLPRAQ